MAELISGILTIIVCYLLGLTGMKLNLIIELHQTVITQIMRHSTEILFLKGKMKP